MFRQFLFAVAIAAGATLASTGCRSCQSCHDYDPPVADCQCGCGGGQRTGSAGMGYVSSQGTVVDNSVPMVMEEVE